MKTMKSIYPVYLKMGLVMATFIIAFMAVSQCHAQQVTITKKDGSVIDSRIIATSTTSLFYPNGNVLISELQSVDIKETGSSADVLSALLIKNKVPVTIQGTTNQTIEQQILKATPKQADLTMVVNSIEKFRTQRQTGKALEMLGMIAVGASILITDDADLQKGLVIGGAALSTVGFIIDLDAGKHLRLRK